MFLCSWLHDDNFRCCTKVVLFPFGVGREGKVLSLLIFFLLLLHEIYIIQKNFLMRLDAILSLTFTFLVYVLISSSSFLSAIFCFIYLLAIFLLIELKIRCGDYLNLSQHYSLLFWSSHYIMLEWIANSGGV